MASPKPMTMGRALFLQWSWTILNELEKAPGTLTYTALYETCGKVRQSMLTYTLAQLAKVGLVRRDEWGEYAIEPVALRCLWALRFVKTLEPLPDLPATASAHHAHGRSHVNEGSQLPRTSFEDIPQTSPEDF